MTGQQHVHSSHRISPVLPAAVCTPACPQCGCVPLLHRRPAYVSWVRGVDTHFLPILFHSLGTEYKQPVRIHFPNFAKILFPFLQVWLSLLFSLCPCVILKLDILVYQVSPTRQVTMFPRCIVCRLGLFQGSYGA